MPKKVILISGGSDGLGKALAEKLAPNHTVVILSHNIDKLRDVAREIGCDFVEGELTDYNSLQDAVNQIIEKHHGLDVLINNAGVWTEGQLENIEPRKIKEIIDVNTTGTILLTKAVLPGMRFRKSGQIINIISLDGLCAKTNRSVYHASKWAITGFTKCVQEDVAKENINVTAVYPGLMNTSLFKKNGVDRDLSDSLDPKEVASLVEYVINLSPGTHIPEVSIKNKKQETQNMDDTTAPVIDLNIDPNMIAAQDDTPQATPMTTPPVQTPEVSPVTPPVANPNLIDITPGSADAFPTTPPAPTHIDFAPPAEPKSVDITPPAEDTGELKHLAELNPEPAAVETTPESTTKTAPEPNPAPMNIDSTPSPMPQFPPMTPPTSMTPPSAPMAQDILPDGNISAAPTPAETPKPEITQSSPLAEDPDLVKLIK